MSESYRKSMRLLKVYRPLQKIRPMNFKFRLNSKRKQFSLRDSPFLKQRWRKISAFLPSSGKTPCRKTIDGVLTLHRCRSWARLAGCARDKPRKQPPAKRGGHNSGSVIPSKCPEPAGRRARSPCPGRAAAAAEGVPHLRCPQLAQGPRGPQHRTRAGMRTLPAAPNPHRDAHPARSFLPQGDLSHLWLTLVPHTWLYLVVVSIVSPCSLNTPECCFLTKIWFSLGWGCFCDRFKFLRHSVFLFT